MTMPALQRNELGDAELVRALAEGNLSGLGVLFDRYHLAVRRAITRMGVSAADVDDLVQATFLDVVKAARRYDGRVSAKAWISGIAIVLVRRHTRGLARFADRLTRLAREPSPSLVPPAEDSVELHEEAERAQRALNALSPRKREVFVMFALEGHSGEEVASVLGIPIATVWTRLHHARKELRKHLAEEDS